MKTGLLSLLLLLAATVSQAQVIFFSSWTKSVDSTAVPVAIRQRFNQLAHGKDEMKWIITMHYDSVAAENVLQRDTAKLRQYLLSHGLGLLNLSHSDASIGVEKHYTYKVDFWQENNQGFIEFGNIMAIKSAQYQADIKSLLISVQKRINRKSEKLKRDFRKYDVDVSRIVFENRKEQMEEKYYVVYYIPDADGKHLTPFEKEYLNSSGAVTKDE